MKPDDIREIFSVLRLREEDGDRYRITAARSGTIYEAPVLENVIYYRDGEHVLKRLDDAPFSLGKAVLAFDERYSFFRDFSEVGSGRSYLVTNVGDTTIFHIFTQPESYRALEPGESYVVDIGSKNGITIGGSEGDPHQKLLTSGFYRERGYSDGASSAGLVRLVRMVGSSFDIDKSDKLSMRSSSGKKPCEIVTRLGLASGKE